MRNRLKWALILASFSLVLAILMQGPQWRYQSSALGRGIAIPINSDESIYMARVQESLSGRPEQTAEAFTGHENLAGTQFAMIERFYGALFRRTGWRASHVLTFMDVVIPVLVFLSLFVFFQLCGFDRRLSFGLAAAFCLLQLYNLNRPIHMRSSFLVMLWSLMLIVAAVRSRWWLGIIGGALLGLLVGVYVWSFAFAWAFFGIYFAWELFDRSSSRKILFLCGCVGLFAALPFVLQYIELSSHPLYEYGSFRSGMHPGRVPESWIYSTLFGLMVLSLVLSLKKHYEALRLYRPAVVTMLAAFVYMNQQVVHGITFNFVSHGIFSLMLAAFVVIGLFVALRKHVLLVGVLAASIYIAAIAYDGRGFLSLWQVRAEKFSMQHMHTALPVLDQMPRARILSDLETSPFIAGYTHHDVVHSVYLKNVLMTHQEIASRFCLTQLPLDPNLRNISERRHLVYPDAVSAFGGDTRAKEEAMVFAACKEVDLDPSVSLETFEVSHILWNTALEPDWDLSRLNIKLDEIAANEGWVLYRIDR